MNTPYHLVYMVCLLLCFFSNKLKANSTPEELNTLLAEKITSKIYDCDVKEVLIILQSTLTKDSLLLLKHIDIKAKIFQKKGALLFGCTERYDEAIDAFNSSLDYFKKSNKKEKELAHTHFLLMNVYLYLDEYKTAIAEGERAIDLMENSSEKDSLKLALYYHTTANSLYGIQENVLAERYIKKSASLYQSIHNIEKFISTNIDLIPILKGQKKYQEAIDIFQKKIYPNRKKLSNHELARAYNLVSEAYLKSGDYKAAEKYYQLSNKHYIIENDPYYTNNIAHNYDNLGIIYKRQKQFDKALKIARKSLELYPNTNKGAIAGSYDNIGDIYAEKKDFSTAADYYQKGIQILLPEYEAGLLSTPSISQNTISNKKLFYILLNAKSKTLLELYGQNQNIDFLKSAYNTAQSLDTLTDQMRQALQTDGAKYILAENAINAYENAIEASYLYYEKTKDKNYLEQALKFSENSRAVVLRESIQDKNAKLISDIPDSLLIKEQDLKIEIAYYESLLFKDPKRELLRDTIFETRRKLLKLSKELENNYPSYYELKYSDATLDISQLKQNIPEDALLIEYFWNSDVLYTFTIDKNEVQLFKKKIPQEFVEQILKFKNSFQKWALIEKSKIDTEKDYLLHAHELYKFLLGDLDLEGKKRLMIIPDNLLGYIPFEALLTKEYEGNWIDRMLPVLIKDYAVSYLYSAHLVNSNSTTEVNRKNHLYGFGGFGTDYKNMESFGNADLSLRSDDTPILRQLPHAPKEIATIVGQIGGQSWLNEDATKENFLSNGKKSGILHLAMHGIIDEKNPLQSHLIFNASENETDNFLYASELYSMKLNADLAVLSACNTGYGELKRGEGIMSLARAFTFAGCPSLVMSLWQVPDKATADIMSFFYDNIKNGATKDVALQQAKLTYLDNCSSEYAKPIYWQSFIISGDINSIEMSTGSFWYNYKWYIIGAAVIFVLLFLGLKWKKP